MTKKVDISVIMSVYNDFIYLEETIESIINQKFQNFEFLIYDDGSDIEIQLLLKKYESQDKRIKIIGREKIGRAKALNKLLRASKGKYIANIDSDDPSYEERLGEQFRYLEENKDIILLGTATSLIDKNGDLIRDKIYPLDMIKIKNHMALTSPFNHSSVMYKRNEILELGGYNENLYAYIDYDLWMRILKKYKAINLKNILSKKRLHENQYFEANLIRKKQKDLLKLKLRAIKELEISKRMYILLGLKIIYMYIPEKLKIFIKKQIKI